MPVGGHKKNPTFSQSSQLVNMGKVGKASSFKQPSYGKTVSNPAAQVQGGMVIYNNRDTTNTTKNTSHNAGSSAMGGQISLDAYQNIHWK